MASATYRSKKNEEEKEEWDHEIFDFWHICRYLVERLMNNEAVKVSRSNKHKLLREVLWVKTCENSSKYKKFLANSLRICIRQLRIYNVKYGTPRAKSKIYYNKSKVGS